MENADSSSAQQEVWAWIDQERRIDEKVRKFAYYAWVTTVGALCVYGLFVLIELGIVVNSVVRGGGGVQFTLIRVTQVLMPLIWVIGAVALIAAVLSTVGVFLRLRTASLAEIQQRLGALEGMMREEAGGE